MIAQELAGEYNRNIDIMLDLIGRFFFGASSSFIDSESAEIRNFSQAKPKILSILCGALSCNSHWSVGSVLMRCTNVTVIDMDSIRHAIVLMIVSSACFYIDFRYVFCDFL